MAAGRRRDGQPQRSATRSRRRTATPVEVTGVVQSLSDGTYRMTDGGPNGLELSMGPTAVIAIGAIRLLVRSQPSMEWDKAMYASQGLALGRRGARLRQVAVAFPAELRPGRCAHPCRQHAGADRARHAPHPLHSR